MLHRKLSQFCDEQRPVWVYLHDRQCWIEAAQVVEIAGDLVTLRYHDDDDDEMISWEESVRLDSIGAVRARRGSVTRSAQDVITTGDCPDAERLERP